MNGITGIGSEAKMLGIYTAQRRTGGGYSHIYVTVCIYHCEGYAFQAVLSGIRVKESESFRQE